MWFSDTYLLVALLYAVQMTQELNVRLLIEETCKDTRSSSGYTAVTSQYHSLSRNFKSESTCFVDKQAYSRRNKLPLSLHTPRYWMATGMFSDRVPAVQFALNYPKVYRSSVLFSCDNHEWPWTLYRSMWRKVVLKQHRKYSLQKNLGMCYYLLGVEAKTDQLEIYQFLICFNLSDTRCVIVTCNYC